MASKYDGLARIIIQNVGGQYQVVIGNHVPDVYDVVCEHAHIQGNVSSWVDLDYLDYQVI
ncbi:hypothetical protein [Lachnobacterium bovis]|uniref:PTS system, beta-glucosides-specific IIC component n=1 Tax=Lachnobacterium bovis TaxID=140626 RepID=A0A1H9TB93_9FIRM|nr:hypothetical protein [Lachnobacterium bovis]SER94317.1 PTS system, beta-glucosides-specific IIC component [Lachnobacterium bovis]